MAAGTSLKATLVILLFVLVLGAPVAAGGQILYVDDDGPAGFNNIQAAIDVAVDGDVVIVAEGRYFENINFNGKNITLRSTDPNDPNVTAATIIDGKNNGTVVTFNNGEDANCVLNGFTITNGYAERGGGIYCFGSSTKLTNCTFTSNSSGHAGGGMYNYKANPILTDCTFIENSTDFQGGGIENYMSSTALTNCTFSRNSSGHNGGGIENNHSTTTLTNCTFSGNSSLHGGGGILNISGNTTLTDCTFNENSADFQGGGVENFMNTTTVTNCTFNRNWSGHNGGGMENISGNTTLTNCTFNENSAGSQGGGMENFKSSTILTNCTFIANTAEFGGGMYHYDGSLGLINCIFIGNSADNRGGGIYNLRTAPALTNCTFAGNLAPNGKALACDSFNQPLPGDFRMNNCILWGGGDQIWKKDTSTITINYSDVQGGWPGKGNIDADPCFVEPGYWDANGLWIDGDYHLLQDSPCIDTGDPNYVTQPNEKDLDGKPRVMGGRIDMGAYESPIFAETRILPRTINLASEGNWVTCYIRLPDEYDVADVEQNSVFLENEIQPEQFSIDQQQQVATAIFNREDVQAILEAGDINLKITGRLADGTVFEAKDIIRV
ncbi:MAG: hypothetical protein GWN67_20385, partial [Phycisphaerae bacterium]|nr:hypothetical protein [Phycisphaerae bacterium]NIP54481.1 hypothetical protein [Phycisphaerae bacterium]NIS53998.1 hypothetical protein [Phycisphaerae bacterium]NIU11607.1 hypothetical protein [Phycisphaerae bacterium]NIU58653.1 hypothetical protein [Phycisphaerae bacterium]